MTSINMAKKVLTDDEILACLILYEENPTNGARLLRAYMSRSVLYQLSYAQIILKGMYEEFKN